MVEDKIRTLIFHPALAPYRLDFFNRIHTCLRLRVIFLRQNLLNQQFNQTDLTARLHCDYGYLQTGVDILSRSFRWGIGKEIRNFRPDVVVVPEFSPITLWVSLLRKISPSARWGVTIHTDDNVRMLSSAGARRRFLINTSPKLADSIVVCTTAAKDFYSRLGFHHSAVGVVPIIRDEGSFRAYIEALTPLAAQLRSENSLSGKRVVLFVGRLVAIKGVHRLLQAFSGASNSVQDTRLVVIGDGPERESLRLLSNELGLGESVNFLGRKEGDELLAWYLLADLFVLPSDYEAYGAVVNEALLAGVPVLCSAWAGASELVTPGRNGDLFEPHDIERLSNLIISYLATAQTKHPEAELKPNLMDIQFRDSVQGFLQAVGFARAKKSQGC